MDEGCGKESVPLYTAALSQSVTPDWSNFFPHLKTRSVFSAPLLQRPPRTAVRLGDSKHVLQLENRCMVYLVGGRKVLKHRLDVIEQTAIGTGAFPLSVPRRRDHVFTGRINVCKERSRTL